MAKDYICSNPVRGCPHEQAKETAASDSELNNLLDAGHVQIKNGIIYNIDEKLWAAEEFEACMLAMDGAEVPRFDKETEAVYSIFGRAMWMQRFGI